MPSKVLVLCVLSIVYSVQAQNVITKDPIDRSVLLDGMVSFTCSYTSVARASWVVTDEAGTNTTISFGGSLEGLTYIEVNTTTIILEVTGSAERNGSCYRCGLLLNSGNIFSQPGCLYVIGPPAAPTVVLYDRTLTSVTVEWYEPFTDPSAPVLYYEVTIDGGQNRILSSDQRMATFTGLTHNTVYSIAVRANNTVGFGDRGFLNATTVTPLAPPKPVNLRSRVEFRSNAVEDIQVMWDAPSLNDSHTNITGYTFEYKLSNLNNFPNSQALPKTTLTSAISGVVQGNTYNVRVRATNNAGDSENAEIDIMASYIQNVRIDTSPGRAVFTCEVAYNDRSDLLCQVSIAGLSDYSAPIQDGSPPSATIVVGSLSSGTYNAVVRVIDNVNNVQVESVAIRQQFAVPVGSTPGGSASSMTISLALTLVLGLVVFGFVWI